MDNAIILIPANKPNHRLPPLVRALQSHGFDVCVVDDGSGPEYDNVFNALDVQLIRYPCNKGKGGALKTGLTALAERRAAVITADADGQHAVADIIRMAEMMSQHPRTLVLGCRTLDKTAPLRSRLGNGITRIIFGLFASYPVYDTQTGLRGLPADAIADICRLAGDRYEYELNMLLWAGDSGVDMLEIPITTLYFDHNEGSHFHTVKDSFRIYRALLAWRIHHKKRRK